MVQRLARGAIGVVSLMSLVVGAQSDANDADRLGLPSWVWFTLAYLLLAGLLGWMIWSQARELRVLGDLAPPPIDVDLYDGGAGSTFEGGTANRVPAAYLRLRNNGAAGVFYAQVEAVSGGAQPFPSSQLQWCIRWRDAMSFAPDQEVGHDKDGYLLLAEADALDLKNSRPPNLDQWQPASFVFLNAQQHNAGRLQVGGVMTEDGSLDNFVDPERHLRLTVRVTERRSDTSQAFDVRLGFRYALDGDGHEPWITTERRP